MDEARRRSRAELRLLAGFALAPLSAVGATFLAFLTLFQLGIAPPAGRPSDVVDSAVSMAAGVGLIAPIVTVFAVVPTVLWVRRRGPLSLGKLLLLGAAFGAAPFALVVGAILVTDLLKGTLSTDVGGSWYGWNGAIQSMGAGIFVGMVSSAVFWLVAVRDWNAEPSDNQRPR